MQNIWITETCPRDGWQNHPEIISTEKKIFYIKKMMDYGAKRIDATSFVNPKYVPQMYDPVEVLDGVRDYAAEKDVTLYALTLNDKGIERAKQAGVKNIEFVISASEEHNTRNSRRSIHESLAQLVAMRDTAADMNILLAVACVFGSPFGDKINMETVLEIYETAKSMGICEFGLADTAGISTPEHTQKTIAYLKQYMDMDSCAMHFHDTWGMGIANAYVAYREGASRFETALAGMGGCPFAAGAKGNIATEDLVKMFSEMGLETEIDLALAVETARTMAADIHTDCASSMMRICH